MKRSVLLVILGVLFLLIAFFCVFMGLRGIYAPRVVETELYAAITPSPSAPPTPIPTAESPVETKEPTPEPAETSVPTPSPTPYISPIDFDALRELNPDIYGWLTIEDTNIDYPIVQSVSSNTYYLTHNSDLVYSANGAIFSEPSYNSGDFSDPVTILYGHHMSSGAMFGKLQQYFTNNTYFSEHPVIYVYTQDALLEYGVFAAVPYSSTHILRAYNFEDEADFTSFINSVMSTRDLNAHFREEYEPETGDRVLVLSTCLAGNNSRRFLVLATLLDE